MTVMNKEKFLKFIVDEIERNQKDVNKGGESKRIVENLIQIYTLTSDGKFDVHSNRGQEISKEIKSVHDQKDQAIRFYPSRGSGKFPHDEGLMR